MNVKKVRRKVEKQISYLVKYKTDKDVYLKHLFKCIQILLGNVRDERLYILRKIIPCFIETCVYNNFIESDDGYTYKGIKLSITIETNVRYKDKITKAMKDYPFFMLDYLGAVRRTDIGDILNIKDKDFDISYDSLGDDIMFLYRVKHNNNEDIADYYVLTIPMSLFAVLFEEYSTLLSKYVKRGIIKSSIASLSTQVGFNLTHYVNLHRIANLDKLAVSLFRLCIAAKHISTYGSIKANNLEIIKCSNNSIFLLTDNKNKALKLEFKDDKNVPLLHIYTNQDLSFVLCRIVNTSLFVSDLNKQSDIVFMLEGKLLVASDTVRASIAQIGGTELRKLLLSKSEVLDTSVVVS